MNEYFWTKNDNKLIKNELVTTEKKNGHHRRRTGNYKKRFEPNGKDSCGNPWLLVEAVSNLEKEDDKLGGPQGESPVRSAKEPVYEASGVSQLRKKHWQ